MSKVNVVSAAIEPRLRLTLVAQHDISTGEVIFACQPAEVINERTWRTIQVAFGQHVKNDWLDYVDHSCEPNAVFEVEQLALVALRRIDPGEPITFFYPGAEVELAQGFACTCGSADCIGEMKGGFYLTADQMRWALGKGYCTSFIAGHLARLLQLPARA